MANIKSIRTYLFYGNEYCDIAYQRDGYITKVCTMPTDEMPKTVRTWLKGKTGTIQYDKIFKREETIYQ